MIIDTSYQKMESAKAIKPTVVEDAHVFKGDKVAVNSPGSEHDGKHGTVVRVDVDSAKVRFDNGAQDVWFMNFELGKAHLTSYQKMESAKVSKPAVALDASVDKAIDALVEADDMGPEPHPTAEFEPHPFEPADEDVSPEEGKELTAEEVVRVEELIQWKLDEFWEGMQEMVADFMLDETSIDSADVARTLAKDVIRKFQEETELEEGRQENTIALADALDNLQNALRIQASGYEEIANVAFSGRLVGPRRGKVDVEFVLNDGFHRTSSTSLLGKTMRRKFGLGASPVLGEQFEVSVIHKEGRPIKYIMPAGFTTPDAAGIAEVGMRDAYETAQGAAEALVRVFAKFCVKED